MHAGAAAARGRRGGPALGRRSFGSGTQKGLAPGLTARQLRLGEARGYQARHTCTDSP